MHLHDTKVENESPDESLARAQSKIKNSNNDLPKVIHGGGAGLPERVAGAQLWQ
jgi:hypothetical protein